MKRSSNVVIPLTKLSDYLLAPRRHNDKSKFLSQAGFTKDNPTFLEQAILDVVTQNEAVTQKTNEYGVFYKVVGQLTGPSGILSVVTIWIVRKGDEKFRFVTLYPDKE